MVETSLTLLAHGHVPLKFWNFAFTMSIMSINQTPTPVLHNKSPFQLLYGKDPNYLNMKPFGCAIFPFIKPYNKNKFAFHSILCVYLGQSPTHCAYNCLDIHTGRIYLARHVKFITFNFPYKSHPGTSSSLVDSTSWL